MIPALSAALLGAQLAVAVAADEPPRLDVEATCRSSASANPGSQTGADGCLRSENEARRSLEGSWARFDAGAKRQCSQQSSAGGFPSYVELLTCLELASGTVSPTRPNDAATSGAPAATGGTGRPSELTREPSADQRTDPLKVLGKPAQ